MGYQRGFQRNLHFCLGEQHDFSWSLAKLFQDLVVDWSLLRPGSQFLRADLGYSNKLAGPIHATSILLTTPLALLPSHAH
jgi:hypothetical protein